MDGAAPKFESRSGSGQDSDSKWLESLGLEDGDPNGMRAALEGLTVPITVMSRSEKG